MSSNAPWDAKERHYHAHATQASTAAPIATIADNTLSGIPVWARTSAGVFTLTLQAEWLENKTVCQAVNANQMPVGITRTSENVITVTVGDDGVLDADISITVWR